jgi:hypothetical protein
MSVMQKQSVEIPAEVQEAWDKVAEFLNGRRELSFFISPWSSHDSFERSCYTLHSHEGRENVIIIANNSWKGRK